MVMEVRGGDVGMCLTSAQLQQKAMERHRLEARLGKLCQRRMLVVVLGEEEGAEGMVASEEELQGGGEEGAAGELAGKRKRGGELAHQPVRHSLWEHARLTGGP